MANLNKVILIGRLSSEPEFRSLPSGVRLGKFSFVVNNRKKNSQTGQWEEDPMFIDCEAYNRGETGKLVDTIEQYVHKGSEICIEGKLILDKWDDKTTGQKRSKHKIIIDALQLLGARRDDGGMGESRPPANGMSQGRNSAPPRSGFSNNFDDRGDMPASRGGMSSPPAEEDDVPF
jgi:single-strand DNA-binding protein